MEKNKIAMFVHYLLLAGAVYLAFNYMMTTPGYVFLDYQIFIILFFVIIIVDSIEHYVMKEMGWD